ncbi:MAG: hypothetical protein HZA48_11680 [Planctomycetes bacterium]|nr:hypothetical protein [Planctomycetota bacterium]
MHKRKKALKYEAKPDLSGMLIRDNTYLDSGLEGLRELSIGYREIQSALKKNSEEHRINAEDHRKNTEEHRINAEEHRKNSEEHERIFNRLNEHSEALKELQNNTRDLRNDLLEMRKSLKETNRAVAALGNIIGYSLEDLAKIILPKWLKSEENIIVHNITRKFTKLSNGAEIETNFVGKGTRNGRPIVVIGEAKTRTYRAEINTFQRYLQTLIQKYHGIEIYPFFVSYLYHDSAKAAAHRHGIRLIESITLVKLTPSGLIMSSPDYNPCYP